jgi:uncharacterized protein DUF3489
MAKQQISKHATKGDRGAANRPARGDERTRRRRPPARAGAVAVQQGASTAAATLPEADVDGNAISTGSAATGRAASQSRAKPRRAGAAGASAAGRPPASTKRAVLIGMLERAEGASVTEIGQRLGWLPHTVRAAITGLRHAGREVTRSRDQNGQSVYRLGPVETPDR